MIIYQITNRINNKFYIGKTSKTTEERFQRHWYNAKYGQDTYLYKAMRKYGKDNFEVKIIEETEDANLREIFWISTLNPHYNMTKGGDGGNTSQSPKFQAWLQRRDMTGANNPMFGRRRTDTAPYLAAAKDKMIQANRCPVMCEGVRYVSVGAAQEAYPGCNLRKRLDNPKYPEFYRLKDIIRRK